MGTTTSQDGTPKMLNSLPERPLTMEEADAIAGDNITPLSILMVGDGVNASASVYTIWVVSENAGMSWVVGYSEDNGGWGVIYESPEEEWDFEEQEEIVQEWISSEYEDKLDSQGSLDPEKGEYETWESS